jgi:hypothetical protein
VKIVAKTVLQRRVFAVFLALTAVTGCRNEMADYKHTVKSGLTTLPWPKQMEALFGAGDHFITHYGFSPGPKKWNTEIYFGGRYSLTLHVDVEIDDNKSLIKGAVSQPKFYLFEVKSLKRLEHTFEADYSGQWIFDEAQWIKLIAAKGDWSALGVPVKKNSPLPDFDEFVKVVRAPRLQAK